MCREECWGEEATRELWEERAGRRRDNQEADQSGHEGQGAKPFPLRHDDT